MDENDIATTYENLAELTSPKMKSATASTSINLKYSAITDSTAEEIVGIKKEPKIKNNLRK